MKSTCIWCGALVRTQTFGTRRCRRATRLDIAVTSSWQPVGRRVVVWLPALCTVILAGYWCEFSTGLGHCHVLWVISIKILWYICTQRICINLKYWFFNKTVLNTFAARPNVSWVPFLGCEWLSFAEVPAGYLLWCRCTAELHVLNDEYTRQWDLPMHIN